jgi:lysophospholipase L1-like esterase
MNKIIFAAAAFITMAFSFSAKKKTIWLIGDSTMSVKDKKAYPETGWGMPFVNFWDSSVAVDNRAMNGRSTRTFMEENRWAPVVNDLQPGDYVFVQFGHNDEVPTKKSYVPEADFKANLLKYISDVKSKNAIPVLITPVARRKFDTAGSIEETHAVYAQIVRDVAKENNVVLIDLDARSKELLQKLGPETSKYLFNYVTAGEHPNYPEGKQDDTHFSELGARRMAELVLAEIRNQIPDLAKNVVVPVVKK